MAIYPQLKMVLKKWVWIIKLIVNAASFSVITFSIDSEFEMIIAKKQILFANFLKSIVFCIMYYIYLYHEGNTGSISGTLPLELSTTNINIQIS